MGCTIRRLAKATNQVHIAYFNTCWGDRVYVNQECMRSMHYTPPKKYSRDYIIIIMRYMGIGQDMIIFLSSRGDLNVALQHHAGYERDC